MATVQANKTDKTAPVTNTPVTTAPVTTAPVVEAPKKAKKEKKKETKEEKFKRLATKRLKVILKNITVLGNLGNRNAYGYNDAQIDTIFTNIENATKSSKTKFARSEEKTKEFNISL